MALCKRGISKVRVLCFLDNLQKLIHEMITDYFFNQWYTLIARIVYRAVLDAGNEGMLGLPAFSLNCLLVYASLPFFPVVIQFGQF